MPKLQQGKLGRPSAPSNPPGSLVARRADEASPVTVRIDDLVANPFQPRIIFDESDIRELADSIAQNGMLQRIGIAVLEDTGVTHIVYGERRWRATKLLERNTIDAIDYGERPAVWFIQQAYNENAKRKDFKLVERIRAYQSLLTQMREETGGTRITQRMLAEKMGESESNVGKYLKIGEHPELVAELEELGRKGEDGSLTDFHARAVAAEGTQRGPIERSQPPVAPSPIQRSSSGDKHQQHGESYTSYEDDYLYADEAAVQSSSLHRQQVLVGTEDTDDNYTPQLRNSSVPQRDVRKPILSSSDTLLVDGEYLSLEHLAEFGLKVEAELMKEGGRLKKEAAPYAAKEFVESMRRLYVAAAGIFGED